ncbi:class I SAM-dependent methyltransferase [Pelagibius sp.]|uniref:class I SAM-dependent methyltransferase n=1 Tax=Pelagibius sp. TaxID=1931238 RepID=UPI003BB01704
MNLRQNSLVSIGPYRLLITLGRCLRAGSVLMELPDGSRHLFEGEEPGPSAALKVIRPRFVRRLLLGGHNGFAEAYVDGDFETEDLTAMIELGALNEAAWQRVVHGHPVMRFLNRLPHLLRANSKSGSKRNIAYHYDLGNAFYEQWLDPSMTYSSAVFTSEGDSLEAAQQNKYRAMTELADLSPDHHLLEVGCGWGGFAAFAAKEAGCRVTGITISEEQYDYARKRVHLDGLAEKVEIRRQDYRDVTGRFDRVASIEMFEAVGERYWPVFFGKLRDALSPEGRIALQIITIDDAIWEPYRRSADFIQRHIFPGGLLPSRQALKNTVQAAGLEWIGDRGFGHDYARTLADWSQRFEAAWPDISALGYDERFRRMWHYYLAYCNVGFKIGRIDVRQIALSRG